MGVIPMVICTALIANEYNNLLNRYDPYIQNDPNIPASLMSETEVTISNIKIEIAFVFIIVTTIVVFASVVFSRRIVYPLKDIIEGINKIKNGLMDTVIRVKTDDEFRDVAESFNSLMSNLRYQQLVLEKTKSNLETRASELQQKMMELEKFSRLTVGRELKMIELKNDIVNLRAELEREKAVKGQSGEKIIAEESEEKKLK